MRWGNVLQEVKDDGRPKNVPIKELRKAKVNRLGDIAAIQEYGKQKAMAWCDLSTVSGLICMKNQWFRIMVVLDAVCLREGMVLDD